MLVQQRLSSRERLRCADRRLRARHHRQSGADRRAALPSTTTLPRVLHKICNDEPDLGPLEPNIVAVLRRALAKEKAQRFQDVEVFVAELVAAVQRVGPGVPAVKGRVIRSGRGRAN